MWMWKVCQKVVLLVIVHSRDLVLVELLHHVLRPVVNCSPLMKKFGGSCV